jgi:hypothetical protein
MENSGIASGTRHHHTQGLKSLTLSRQMKRTSKLLCYDTSEPALSGARRHCFPTFAAGTTKEPKQQFLPSGRFCKL